MAKPTEVTREVLATVAWQETRSRNLPSAHVNIQELTEMGCELQERADADFLPAHICNADDSRVSIGALAKTGSSSTRLNAVIRSSVGPMVLGSRSRLNTWCCSDDNPADEPSCFRPLRAPVSESSIPVHLSRPVCPGNAHALSVLRELRGKQFWPALEFGPDGGRELFAYLWSEADRSFRPRWAREVFAGAAGLTRALRHQGLFC
jgi:hypothetical protein